MSVKNEIKQTNTVKLALEHFRQDMEMSNLDWIRFCKRYATRNVSTIVGELSKRYGPMPKNAACILKEELGGELKRIAAYEQYRAKK